jgi:hypothetical protein
MMKHPSNALLAFLVLIGSTLACNVPGSAQPVSVNDQAATVIALTLQALTPTGSDIPLTATATVTPRAISTTTPTRAATTTITPTFSTPMLTVQQQTNCREGPGQNYEVVFTYLPNKKLQILGRYDPTNYWLVKSDESSAGHCWLWGEYVEVKGSYWAVPSVTPPATATLAPPQAASVQDWHFECSGGTMTFTLTWTDRASNETGYRVHRDDQVIELPANSTSFTESIPLLSGESVEYYLEVYGPGGSAGTPRMKITC